MTLTSRSRVSALAPFYLRVLEACADEPSTVTELADRLEASPGRVLRALGVLKARGLALESRPGVCRATPSGSARLALIAGFWKTRRESCRGLGQGPQAPPLTPASVRAARIGAGLTQLRLSEIAGISEATLRRFESGGGTASPLTLRLLTLALRPGHCPHCGCACNSGPWEPLPF